MSDRTGMPPMTDPELEAALADLGRDFTWPTAPDLASVVTSRIADRRVADRPTRRPVVRSLRRSLLLAAAIVLLVAGAALAVRFGLGLLTIQVLPEPGGGPIPTVRSSPSRPVTTAGAPAPGASLRLGRLLPLNELIDAADFPVVVPDELGAPDAAFLGGASVRGQIALVYASRKGLPPSDLLDGAGILVTENRGEVDPGLANKIVISGQGTVESVDVGGFDGYWFAGEPHWFWYLGSDGTYIEDSRRLVGNTLAWQHGDILYRIEGAIDLDQALVIARSMS